MSRSKPRWTVRFTTDQSRRVNHNDPTKGWVDGKRNYALQQS